mgnify:CR=1 FL=1
MAVQQTFIALGKAKASLFIACLRKVILLVPLIYILPNFFEDKVFAVFLAEPVSDAISITTASVVFFFVFGKEIFENGKFGTYLDKKACFARRFDFLRKPNDYRTYVRLRIRFACLWGSFDL